MLVVDDDRDTAESLEIFLRHAGHQARIAHDGAGGVAAARTWRPDVVVLDIGLPDCDGYEVARRMRQELALAGTTLVALSGYGDDVGRSRTAGFDYHLVKPIDAEILLDIVDGHGGRTGRHEPRRVERLTPGPRASGTR